MRWYAYGCHCLLLFCLLLSLSGCRHKDLYYGEQEMPRPVTVLFDWSKSSDAVPGSTPADMRVWIFSSTTKQLFSTNQLGALGGNISLPPGLYQALALNYTTDVLHFSADNGLKGVRSDDFEIYGSVNQQTKLPEDANPYSEPVIWPLTPLWGQYIGDVEIANGMNKRDTIFFTPTRQVARYTIEIRNITNLEYVSGNRMSLSLTGLSGGLYPQPGTLSPIRSVIQYERCEIDREKRVATASFYTFGRVLEPALAHLLGVYMRMSNGEIYYQVVDVTPQLLRNNPDGRRDVHIVVDKLDVPKPLGDKGSGIAISVEEWEEVLKDLTM